VKSLCFPRALETFLTINLLRQDRGFFVHKHIKKILPQLQDTRPSQHQKPLISSQNPTMFTREDCDRFVIDVKIEGPDKMGKRLEDFLNLHRTFANKSNNPHYLVRTFNRLAEAARTHAPNWAVARAEETLAWDPNNARNWTVLARCLWTRGRLAYNSGHSTRSKSELREAINTLWVVHDRIECV